MVHEDGMLRVPEDLGRENSLLHRRDSIVSRVPVPEFLGRYEVRDTATIEAVLELPTLAYLIGRVSPKPILYDNRPDGKVRPIRLLQEGSGMFGLTDKDDALRWKGMHNHTCGTARQVEILSDFFTTLTPRQVQAFSESGYDTSTLSKINPYLYRDFMLSSHIGRRETDETNWHHDFLLSTDPAHQEIDPGRASLNQLERNGADAVFLNLMRVEIHGYLLNRIRKNSMLRDFEDIALTVPDWMFGQKPNSLEKRFQGLLASKRAPEGDLLILKRAAIDFQNDFERITERNLLELMTSAEPFGWEDRVRKAYCSPSGINPRETFPDFYEQYPGL